MKLKTHPILKELQINENGTEIIFQGNKLNINSYKNKKSNYPSKIVHFRNRTHSVPKLVCETFNGMRDNMDHVIKRRDLNPKNDHYTNLYWGNRGQQGFTKNKMHHKSKLTPAETQEIVERLKNNESQNSIAKVYGVSRSAIYFINKYHLRCKKSIFKRETINAEDNYDKRKAFAKYLGFDSIAAAVEELGKEEFIKQHQEFTF